jgi:hypothetical protein
MTDTLSLAVRWINFDVKMRDKMEEDESSIDEVNHSTIHDGVQEEGCDERGSTSFHHH